MPASDSPPPASTAAAAFSSPSSSESSSQPEHTAQSPTRQSAASSADIPDLGPCLSTATSKTDVPIPDLEKHPKGKRKRTAAKDKTILENAYLANPKPDKTARLDIVKRVSLNEKEVQIWFQNRRQNDRRKSRPLSAQEIAALRYGGMQILSSDPVTYISSVAEEKTSPAAVADIVSSYATALTETPIKSRAAGVDDLNKGPCDISPSNAVIPPGTKAMETPTSQISDSISRTHSASFSISSSIGFMPCRWNLTTSFSTPSTILGSADEPPKSDPCPPSSRSSTTSAAPILPPPQSHMRLSLSLEGKAELVSNEASPPRLQSPRLFQDLGSLPQVRSRTFQRSHSALPGVTLPPISALTDSLPPSLGRGRSRDAHAWELCCDADTRDELTTQAENESNGSAVAAISLLRSTSGVLHNNTSKRNSPASKPTSWPQQAKKPRLCRTFSSVARMQTSLMDGDKALGPPADEKRIGNKLKDSMLASPSGDSDKENWLPDEEGNLRQMTSVQDARRPLPTAAANRTNSRRTGRILRDHPGPVVFCGSRAKTMPAMNRRDSGKDLRIYEDGEDSPVPKATDEVERFMRGEVSPSKKGDMDCIAGLLSLSQGNWR